MRMRAKYVKIQHASARGIADRWRKQYQTDGKWSSSISGNAKNIYDLLCAEGANISIERAAEIIGNQAWSYIWCDSCGEYVSTAVELGEYEQKSYCKACIMEAAEVLKP